MKKWRILVTWWAGYIWSHIAVELLNEGFKVHIMDNFSNSKKNIIKTSEKLAWKSLTLHELSLLEKDKVDQVFKENPFEAVIHLAWNKSVWESCVSPFSYYENNIHASSNLFQIMEKHSVKNLVFSSTATVYDTWKAEPPFNENDPIGNSQNPYTTSKLCIEKILWDLSKHKWRKVVNLRYFNPIGAHESWLLWESLHKGTTNVFPLLMKALLLNERFIIFWDDYETKDWTCIRDYIHVMDLAEAHIKAINLFKKKDLKYESINIWTGKGTSVLELIGKIEKNLEKKMTIIRWKRRDGDLPVTYATVTKAEKMLHRKAKRDINDCIKDGYRYYTHLFRKSQ